jgi:hypothetical protein
LFTFTPVADAYVKSTSATSNFGSAVTLFTDTSPVVNSYLRFTVQGLSTPIRRATLRVFANSSSNSGYILNSVTDNTWGELSLNYNSAPAVGGALGSSGPIAASAWTTVDVTSYITGNGTFSLALTGLSSTQISLASRETGANAPQLVIEAQPGSATATPTATTGAATATPTRTATSAAGPTATPSRTPTPTATFTTTPTLMLSSLTFNPNADAYVNSGSPAMNYGSLMTLRADASPVVQSYLRFEVQGLSGAVTRATLRIFTNSSSSTGYEVRNVADTSWGELTINYSNAPAVGAVTSTSGAFGTGIWTAVDITPLVSGNGTLNLALTTTNATAFSLASRESGANAPQLVVETSP